MNDVDIDMAALDLALHEQVDPDIKRRTENVKDRAFDLAPKSTGRLANALTVEKYEDGYAAVSPVPYSEYQEFGTEDDEGQPYMRPALDAGAL